MADITLNYLNEEREKTWERIARLENSVDELNQNIQEALDLAKSKISVDEANAKTALVNATAYAETAKNKLTEENKKFKVLKPQNEDPFYYWNM